MRTCIVLAALLAIFGCGQREGVQPESPSPEPAKGEGAPAAGRARPEAADAEVAALIDKLTEVAAEGPGTHSTAWAAGFMAVDEEFAFAGGILGSRRPVVDPAMRQLVRLGVRALPDLLGHLADARKTRLTVDRRGDQFGGAWHGDEYDPRHRDPRMHPPGVNTGDDSRSVEFYTLRVGDLCYVAVGQIVNRHLAATRYQPTACLVINSPVQTPVLAAAARQDWAGLTRAGHTQSLTEDALDKSPAATAAMRRLCFYYPGVGETLALRLLSRPLYDYRGVRDFIKGRLVKEKGRQGREKLIADLRGKQGEAAAEAVPFLLDQEGTPDARKILAELYPGYDPVRPTFINAADADEQADLVAGLSGLGSTKVDEAVASMFRSLDPSRHEADPLALACMRRLVGKGMDREFKAYCTGRIAELQKGDGKGYMEEFKKILARIREGKGKSKQGR